MAERKTVHIKGEGGVVFELALPLHESIADRLESGHLRRVNPDGTHYVGPVDDDVAAPPESVPAVNAPKKDWVAWAVAQGADPEDAAAMTKADLIDKHGSTG